MTKLLQQLSFSSSIYGSAIEPAPAKEKQKNCFGDGASLSAAGSKRSAVSASDAECFSLCLGAGPLWLQARRLRVLEAFIIPLVAFYDIHEKTWSGTILTRRHTGGPDVPANDSAPPGGVNGGAVSPATPSTPTHDDNNRDLLSALLWGSASSLGSSAESLYSEPHPALQTQHQQAVVNKILERKDRQPVKIDFKIFLTENTVTRWEAVVQGNSMFLRVPGVLQSGSKESFMLLLDFAEERLHVANCIICVLKSRPERATLLRTFMFMGFSLLPPAAPLLPPELANPDYIFLHYNMQ